MLQYIYGLEKTSGMKYNIYNYTDMMYRQNVYGLYRCIVFINNISGQTVSTVRTV